MDRVEPTPMSASFEAGGVPAAGHPADISSRVPAPPPCVRGCAWGARLAALAPTLKQDPARAEAAFALAAALAFADSEIEDSENEVINSLAEALELGDDRTAELLDMLEVESE